MTTHTFAATLSIEERCKPRWDEFYRMHWPGWGVQRVGMVGAYDRELQRAGVDVVLQNNTQRLHLDEKNREKDYGDCFLEVWSVFHGAGDSRNKPGWTVDPDKITDLIVYGLEETSVCWVLGFQALRRATESWRNRPLVPVRNDGYDTMNVAVSWDEITHALAGLAKQYPWPKDPRPRKDAAHPHGRVTMDELQALGREVFG